jgi:hypothetical protein
MAHILSHGWGRGPPDIMRPDCSVQQDVLVCPAIYRQYVDKWIRYLYLMVQMEREDYSVQWLSHLSALRFP